MKLSVLIVAAALGAATLPRPARAESLIERLGFGSYKFEKANVGIEPVEESGVGSLETRTSGRLLIHYEEASTSHEIVLEIPVTLAIRKVGAIAKHKTGDVIEETMKIWNVEGLRLGDLLGEYRGVEISATPLILNIGESVLFKRGPDRRRLVISDLQNGLARSPFSYIGIGAALSKVSMAIRLPTDDRILELIVSREHNVSRIFDLTPDLLGSRL